LVGFGQIAVVAVDAEQAIDCPKFGKCCVNGRLGLNWFSIDRNGNKGTQKRL
tara:strand:- start:1297 stop:1452 length:156 start_codon:yes stop_codon:yes gene_type:complete